MPLSQNARAPEAAGILLLRRLMAPRFISVMVAFATKGATAAMLFLQSVVVSRYLGVEAVGVYSSAMAVYRIAESCAPFGIPMSAVREVGAAHATQSWQTIRSVAFNATLICLALGGAAALLIGLGKGVIAGTFEEPADAARALGWMVFAILPGCGVLALTAVLRGLGRQGAANVLGAMLVSIIATISFVFWTHGDGFVGAIQSYVAGQAVALLSLAGFVWWLTRKGTGEAPVRHSLFESAPSFWIITLASFGNDSLGVLLLGMLGSVADAGIFGVAARLALPLSFLSASVQAVYEPRFAGSMRAGTAQQLKQEFRTSLKHSFVLAAGMLLVMAILAEPLLRLFGGGFSNAWAPFVVILAGLCVMAAFGPAGSFLAMTGKARYNAWIALASLPASVVLHALLIPEYGALGAACATTAVLLVRTLVQAWAAFAHLATMTRNPSERETRG